MTKNQIDNLINFCFHFHKSMGFSIKGVTDFSYIEEKWNKYIGFKPIESDSIIEVSGYGENIKEILYFIQILNSKPLNTWCVSELVNSFKFHIGNTEEINKNLYTGLHMVIRNEVEIWLNKKDNLRDYKLMCILK